MSSYTKRNTPFDLRTTPMEEPGAALIMTEHEDSSVENSVDDYSY
jgi:hypothetical protein